MTVRTWSTALSAVVLLTGCGSELTPVTAPSRSPSSASASPAEPSISPTPTAVGTPDAIPSSSASAAPTRSGGATAGPALVAAVSPSPRAPDRSGYDDRQAFLGVVVPARSSQAEAAAQAVLRQVNAEGGTLGRQLVAVVRTAAATTCTDLTAGRGVVAVLDLAGTVDLSRCLAEQAVPLLTVAADVTDASSQQALAPYLYPLTAPALDDVAPLLVTRLRAQQWTTGWNPSVGAQGAGAAKVGIVHGPDTGAGRAAAQVKGAFEQRGLRVVTVQRYAGSARATVDALQSAGATHVVALDAVLPILREAEDQRYRPRYALTSFADTAALQTAAPAAQLAGSAGIGWLPLTDVDGSHDGGANPGSSACDKTMSAARVDTRARSVRRTAALSCDAVLLLDRAVEAYGSFSPRSVRLGAARVGPSFPTASTFRPGTTGARAYLPGGARDLAWDATAGAFRYSGTTIAW